MINDHLKRSVFISLAILKHGDITAATFITAGKYGALSDMFLNTYRFALFVIEKVNRWLTNNRTVSRNELVFESCSPNVLIICAACAVFSASRADSKSRKSSG
jgi:hypothetical protein